VADYVDWGRVLPLTAQIPADQISISVYLRKSAAIEPLCGRERAPLGGTSGSPQAKS